MPAVLRNKSRLFSPSLKCCIFCEWHGADVRVRYSKYEILINRRRCVVWREARAFLLDWNTGCFVWCCLCYSDWSERETDWHPAAQTVNTHSPLFVLHIVQECRALNIWVHFTPERGQRMSWLINLVNSLWRVFNAVLYTASLEYAFLLLSIEILQFLFVLKSQKASVNSKRLFFGEELSISAGAEIRQ